MNTTQKLAVTAIGCLIVAAVMLSMSLSPTHKEDTSVASAEVSIRKTEKLPPAPPTVSTKFHAAISDNFKPETIEETKKPQLLKLERKSSFDLADKYPFMEEAMAEEEPFNVEPDAVFDTTNNFPVTVEAATLVLHSQDLDVVFIRVTTPEWCDGSFCSFTMHAKKNDKYDNVLSIDSSPDTTYYLVEPDSFSLLICTRDGTRRRWQLNKGDLDKPMPMDAPGHVKPVGAYTGTDVPACTKP